MRAPRIPIRDHDVDDTRWKARALCFTGGYNPDLWFPDSYRNDEGRAQARVAVSICARCPVFEECLASITLEEATKSLEKRDGIWAGTTPEYRYNLAKRNQYHQRVAAAQMAAAA